MTVLVVLAAAGWVAADERGASVAESAPVSDLLKRARDGVRRGEWKFAVDSLQRIIDDPQGALTTLDGEVYESARMQAYRQLGALPVAGRNTYHLLYDGGALRLYEEALAAGDFEMLQHVVDRYLLTASGSRAALTLANWYIDLNKPGAAITILTDLKSLLPQDDRRVTTTTAMLAVAYAQLQRGKDAQGYLDALRQDRSLPEPWRQRIVQIEAFLAGQLPQAQAASHGGGWPMAYGDLARTGRMPATTPVLLDGLPWRFELPQQSPPPWSAVVDRQARDNLLLAAQMVTDGENLYLKAANDVAAIDLLNFELNWISKGPSPTTSRRSGNRVQRFDPWGNAQPNTPAAQEARLVQRALWDDVDAQLSIAHGLIFDLVVDAEQANSANWNSTVNRLRRLRRPTPVQRAPNVLIARDPAQQGRIVWSMGSGQDVSTPPHQMIFASTPVQAGDNLLVTYWSGKDLYVGLLNPTDGDLLESIYLCTMADDFLRIPAVLPPALDDQFAYIPTNAGMLLALNLGDRSLRWASRYERASPGAVDVRAGRLRIDAEVDRSGRWLTGPPLVAGATVLLAPSDSDYLYAFNRATGKKLWTKERGEHTYIVAADNVNLWLGGRYLTMVELANGKSVWHLETPSATGRAVLSGDRLLVPTRNGLLVIDSENGQSTELQPLPADHPPLGNLLCWDGALYSIDSQRVRKFPDLERSYEPAKRMHAADPTDATAAIRLAWMELLRQQPEQVLSTLEGVVIDDSSPGQSQAANVAHLRVQALLASVRLSKIPSAEAEGRLRQACELARSAPDQFQATVDLADRLVRNHKKDEAYQRVWRLAQTDEMTGPHERTPVWKRSMRAVLFDKLAGLSDSMSPAQQSALAQNLRASTLLDEEPTRKNRRELGRNWGRLTEGDDLENWNQLAALKLGRLYQSRRKFEQAEYYYRKAASLHLQTELTGTALVELGQMYVGQGPAAASLAAPVFDRLDRELSDITIEGSTGKEISKQLRDELQVQLQRSDSRFGAHAEGEDSKWLDKGFITGQLLDLGSVDTNAGGAGSTRYAGGEFMLSFSAPNHLAAYRPGDGKRIWPVTLRLPSESSLEDDTTRRVPLVPRPLRARSDGQTLVLNTETSLHAVGLITGRRLWSIPIDVPEPRAQNVADGQLFDIRHGKVAVRMNAHQLDLRRSVDGHDRLWSVQIPEYIVSSVQIAKNRVVAIDHHGLTAVVFNLHDGERLFEITFTSAREQLPVEPVGPAARAHLLIFPDLICGVEDGAIAGYSLADGKQLWTRPFEFPPTSFFRASDQCGLVGGADGHLLAFAVADGEILYEGLLHSFPTSGLLAVHHEQERLFLAGKGNVAGSDEVQLAAIDLKNDELLWINDDLKSPICGPQSLGVLPDMIPLLYPQLRGANRNQPKFLGGQDPALVFLDKRTGKLAAEPLVLKFDTAQTVPSGEMAFWPGRVAIGTSEGIKIAPLAFKDTTTRESW